MPQVIRSIEFEFNPGKQKRLIDDCLYSARRYYNLLIEHTRSIRISGQQQRERAAFFLFGLEVAWSPQCWLLLLANTDHWLQYWQDSYRQITRKGWASEYLRSIVGRSACVWPRQDEVKTFKSGKRKGESELVPVIRNQWGKKQSPEGASGITGQCLGLIAQSFEANIQSCFTKWKQGDFDAQLPKRFKSQYPLYFSNQQSVLNGKTLTLGANPFKIQIKLPQQIDGAIRDAKLRKTRGGKYVVSLTLAIEPVDHPELTNIAAIDFGQKRAIVISTETDKGIEVASISGKNILALKREREYRHRELNRKRSRVLKGHIRQYLTPEQKAVYRQLQEQDNDRQRKGKNRTGADTKYAHRMISQARKEQGLRKFSRRQMSLKRTQAKMSEHYRARLKYANHCITRAAVDWAVERNVGKIFVGDLETLPKRRRKGNRRIKQVHRNVLWEMPTQRQYLQDKLIEAGAPHSKEDPCIETHHERRTSQTCPNCGALHKPRSRVYKCRSCGWMGDRDGVGSVNFLSLVKYGECGKLMPSPQRTLPIAPAIGQCLPMLRPSRKRSEPSEELTPEPTILGLQASPYGAAVRFSGLAETPAKTGQTKVRDSSKVLAKAVTLSQLTIPELMEDSTTTNTGEKPSKPKRCLRRFDLGSVQLSLWDSA
jgi:transposase